MPIVKTSMPESRSTLITIAVLLLIIVVAGLYTYYTREAARSAQDASGSAAAAALSGEVRYTTLGGGDLALSEYLGEGVLVVNSWASWCPFCVNELPDFGELAQEYKDQRVTVIAVNRKEDSRTANNFVATLEQTVDDVVFALDPDDVFYKAIGGFTMPETVFYDRAGNIAVHKRGFMPLEEMRLHTATALNTTNA